MYTTINGYPVEDFCEWYNEKYDSDIEPSSIEFDLSYDELSEVSHIMTEELGEYDDDKFLREL